MTRYWKKKLWEEYGVIVKKIRHFYNPFTSWGFASENYIVYYWSGSLIENYDRIFHDAQEIIKFLEEQEKRNQDNGRN